MKKNILYNSNVEEIDIGKSANLTCGNCQFMNQINFDYCKLFKIKLDTAANFEFRCDSCLDAEEQYEMSLK